MKSNTEIKRNTGLLVIEVVNSNPNGDPDRESDPRQRYDGRGIISPVSFKRKLRDLVEDKEGPVWTGLGVGDNAKFGVFETRGRDRKQIEQDLKSGSFTEKYWDGRIFGNTFLEKEGSTTIRTGIVQFGLGVSVAPVEIERMTMTSKAGVQEGKDRGMAPMGYRIVKHGVYCMPFFVNPTAARKTGCTAADIDLLFRLIPYAYAHTASFVRPSVEIRHAWLVEHKSALGSCSDFALIDALTPCKKTDPDQPSTSWKDYDDKTCLPEALSSRICSLRDLMTEVDGEA